jgi:hypothetical protein
MRFYGIFAERHLDECLCNVSERTVFAAGAAMRERFEAR